MWTLVREGGFFAYVAAFCGVLGVLVGVAALCALIFSRRAAFWLGIAALVLATFASSLGVVGMQSGIRKTAWAIAEIPSSVSREQIRVEGFFESRSVAQVGLAASLVPFVLGGVAMFVGAFAKEAENHRGRVIVASVVAFVAFVPVAGVFAASRALPAKGRFTFDRSDRRAWDLAYARDAAADNMYNGCDTLDAALSTYWVPRDRAEWPRHFEADPDSFVPNTRETATKCARRIFDELKVSSTVSWRSKTWTPHALSESPLLVDETLHKDLADYMLSHGAGTGSGGFGVGHGWLGKRPPAN